MELLEEIKMEKYIRYLNLIEAKKKAGGPKPKKTPESEDAPKPKKTPKPKAAPKPKDTPEQKFMKTANSIASKYVEKKEKPTSPEDKKFHDIMNIANVSSTAEKMGAAMPSRGASARMGYQYDVGPKQPRLKASTKRSSTEKPSLIQRIANVFRRK